MDRQQISLSATPNPSYNFYGWFGPPYPQGGNPYPFLIQSPESNLQGAFTTFPVTTIGETITGPTLGIRRSTPPSINNFTYLPQGYSRDQSGSGRAPGTSHSISAASPAVPVTTNVSYSWNSWSDGCAQTHNITASSSGVESIAAPFTQVYRSYRSYTYAQNDCGAVQYSQSCPNNDCCFPDGTLLTMTATPYAGNGMIFSGWTGDLSGTADPATTTVHDEFLPLANFNIVPTVIHATGVSPPLPVKDVRRHPDRDRHRLCERKFFAYWNNSFRTSTNVTPTQATIHLNAGDLANPGAQLLQVSNFTCTNPSCGAYAFTQVLGKNSQGTPRLQITKTHQGNFTGGRRMPSTPSR